MILSDEKTINDEILHLAIRCTNLRIKVNHNAKMFTRMNSLFGINDTTAQEKRYVKISQSNAFTFGNRPSSLTYTDIYTSETIDGLYTNDGIYPHLIVTMKNYISAGQTCCIRLSVFVTSPRINGGRDSYLCGVTINLRDIKEHFELEKVRGPSYETELMSEYCEDAKVFMDLLRPLRTVGMEKNYIHPFESKRERFVALDGATVMPNPLSQHYVLFDSQICSDQDNKEAQQTVPRLFVEENVYEPRNFAEIPILLLENVSAALNRSLQAWRERREIEMNRQGFFKSHKKAFKRGWQHVSVRVMSTRLHCTMAEAYREQNVKRPYTYYTPYSEHNTEVGNLRLSDSSERGSSKKSTGNAEVLSTREDASKKFGNGIIPRLSTPKGGRPDTTRPCTYVKVALHDINEPFHSSLGRTNTEYYTFDALYGSNIHQDAISKPKSMAVVNEHTSAQLDVQEEVYHLDRYDVKENEKKESLLESEAAAVNNPIDTVVEGLKFTFKKYITSSKENFVMFSLALDAATNTITGNKDVDIGTCVLPLSLLDNNPGQEQTFVLEMRLSKSIHKIYPYLSAAEVTVAVQLNMETDPERLDSAKQYNAAPARIPFSTYHLRSPNGNKGINPSESGLIPNPCGVKPVEEMIGDSCEWLWYVGFLGKDPLALSPFEMDVDEVPTRTPRKSSVHSKSVKSNSVRLSMVGDMMDSQDIDEDEEELEIVEAAAENDEKDISDDESDHEKEETSTDILDKVESGQDVIEDIPDGNNEGNEYEDEEEEVGRQQIYTRIDVPYTLNWIDTHISSLESLSMELMEHLVHLRNVYDQGVKFRPSSSKSKVETQALPINFHMQVVSINRYDLCRYSKSTANAHDKERAQSILDRESEASRCSSTSSTLSTRIPYSAQYAGVEVLESLTCGSFSPHYFEKKEAGGLDAMKQDIIALHRKIQEDMHVYATKISDLVRKQHPVQISSYPKDAQEKVNHARERAVLVNLDYEESAEGKLFEDIRRNALQFETDIVKIAKRRLMSLTQVLSVATNGFLMKLALVIEEVLPVSHVMQWANHGFFIVFESLLSVHGKERFMLEDTIGATEMIRDFAFVLIPMTEASGKTEKGIVPIDEVRLDSADIRNRIPHYTLRGAKSDTVNIGLRGREIVLYIPLAAFAKLPSELLDRARRRELKIKIKPTMFTLGLDFNQTISSTFGGGMKETQSGAELKNALDLQHSVNMRGIVEANAYCTRVNPIDDTVYESISKENSGIDTFDGRGSSVKTEKINQITIHPLIKALESQIRYVNKTKNVSMLIEVERMCSLLNGCRVTFCKSGKDRTGKFFIRLIAFLSHSTFSSTLTF